MASTTTSHVPAWPNFATLSFIAAAMLVTAMHPYRATCGGLRARQRWMDEWMDALRSGRSIRPSNGNGNGNDKGSNDPSDKLVSRSVSSYRAARRVPLHRGHKHLPSPTCAQCSHSNLKTAATVGSYDSRA